MISRRASAFACIVLAAAAFPAAAATAAHPTTRGAAFRLDPQRIALADARYQHTRTTVGAIAASAAHMAAPHPSALPSLSVAYQSQKFTSYGSAPPSVVHVFNLVSRSTTTFASAGGDCAYAASLSLTGAAVAYGAYLSGVKSSQDPYGCNGPETIVVVAGSTTAELGTLPTYDFYYSIAWSPDSSALAVTRVTSTSTGQWTSANLEICHIALRSCSAVPGAGVGAGVASYSPDGTHLVADPGFLTTANYLETMTVSGGSATPYPATGVSLHAAPDYPAYSPDGTRIVFCDATSWDSSTNWVTEGGFELTLATGNVTHLRLIGSPGAFIYDLGFAPGGQALFFDKGTVNVTTGRYTAPNSLYWSDPSGDYVSPILTPSSTTDTWFAGAAGTYPTPGAASSFTAVTPTRLLDTRSAGHSPLGAGGTADVTVAGVASIPADATSVAVNVTAIGPSATTDLSVYPTPASGSAVPAVSTLNAAAHQIVANSAIVPVGAGGKIRVRNNSGAVNVLLDITGYFAPGSAGDLYTPAQTPAELTSFSLSGPASRVIPVIGAGAGQVPVGADAVVVEVAARTPTTGTGSAQTDVQVYPDGTSPSTSALNLDAYNESRVNVAIVPIGSDGSIDVAVPAQSVAVSLTTLGYLQAGTGLVYHPVTPTRIFDTRYGENTAASTPQPLTGPDGTLPVLATGPIVTLGGVADIPPTAQAIVMNVTAIDPNHTTSISVGAAPSSGLGVDVEPGQVMAAATIPHIGALGKVTLTVSGIGSLNGLLDVFGYFSAS